MPPLLQPGAAAEGSLRRAVGVGRRWPGRSVKVGKPPLGLPKQEAIRLVLLHALAESGRFESCLQEHRPGEDPAQGT